MNLAQFSIKNSLLVNMVSFFFVISGLLAMFNLPLDMFPAVDYDIVTVRTAYPGAPTEDIEKFVTIPIEKELKGISGIKDLESSSDEGSSIIAITLDPEISDKEQVIDDIRTAVDRVRDLPEGVEDDPYVVELKSKERPVLEVSISGPYPESKKRQYAEALEDLLLDIDGISSVRRIAWRDREYWVELDPKKMDEYYVSFQEVTDALRTRNITLPGGQVETTGMEYSVRITGEFTTPKEIGEVVIRSNDAGHLLKVKDIAVIKDTYEDKTHISKVNREKAVAMVVIKSEYGDVVRLATEAKKVVEQFEQQLPEGMEATITNDFSYYVKRRLGVLKNNGIIGFILVLIILFIFLDFVPALMTAIGIPIAFFITFILMSFANLNINLVSMLGLIIVLGMLVDDGIIVAENVYRHVEGGLSPKEAAIKGTQEVIPPVTVTILTTCAAFAPLLFMKDIIGKFIKEVPMVVIFALIASLIEAFIILPSHLADLISLQQKKGKIKKNEPKKWFQKTVHVYTGFLKWALNYRYLFVFGILTPLFISSILLFMFGVKREFFPSEGIEQFYVRAEAKKGTPLDRVNELILPVEEEVSKIDSTYMDSFRTYLGSIEEERGFDPNAKRGTHLGQITVFLTPFQSRDKTAREISDELQGRLDGIEGFEKLYVTQRKAGPPVGKAISVAIKGDSHETLTEIAAKYEAYLATIDGVSNIDTSYQSGKKQLKVIIDEQKARKFYLTIADIARSVRTAFKGSVATSIKPEKAEEEINVVVRFREDERNQLKAFERILISNQFGKLVPLNSVAQVVEEDGLFTINHKDGKRVVYVTANLNEKKISSLKANQKIQKDMADVANSYLGYTVFLGGEFEEQMKSRNNLLTSFAIALCIIFIILTAMFKSLLQPFIVMLAIPFGLIGVILAFYLHDKSIGFFAMMGIVGLTGVVVNDSIVLVDFINRLRIKGKDRRHSLIEAGQIRLRPVIMTTVTTIGGLVAVAYGIGGGDPFLKPMALAIVWGLLFATVLTLVIIPCIYAIFDDIAEKCLHHSLVKKNGNNNNNRN